MISILVPVAFFVSAFSTTFITSIVQPMNANFNGKFRFVHFTHLMQMLVFFDIEVTLVS